MKNSEVLIDLLKRLSSNIITDKEGNEWIKVEHYNVLFKAIKHFKQEEAENCIVANEGYTAELHEMDNDEGSKTD